jgi:hypothetical protein
MPLSQISLALFLSVYGLINVSNVRFEGTNLILGGLALITAVLIFAKK